MGWLTKLASSMRSGASRPAREVKATAPADVDGPSKRVTGTVRFFNDEKGYGFITDANGNEVFAHHAEIAGTGYRKLEAGEKVTFAVKKGRKGPEAVQIQAVRDDRFEPGPAKPVDPLDKEAEVKRQTGTVRFYNPDKGFGFITDSGGQQVFVHVERINGPHPRELKGGQSVTFTVKEGRKGPEAYDVRAVG